MIARQEVICRKACAVPLATCFAASASNAATKGLADLFQWQDALNEAWEEYAGVSV